MADLLLTAALATASNHALSVIKHAYDRVKASGKAEIISDYMDIQGAMMDMQLKQQDLITQMAELQARNKELEEALRFTGELVRDGNCLYLKSDTEHEEPYCMACWGYEKKLVGLIRGNNHFGSTIKCPICIGRKRD
jgi:hypothetical protein